MTRYHPLIGIAEMAVSFTEADAKSRANIESEVQTIFNRYPTEKEDLLKLWDDLVRYMQKHRREKPEEPVSVEEALLGLLNRYSM
jgi:hypothetical protein